MAVDVMADTIRLDKFLVEMGFGSRSQIKDAAKKGRVSVDGVVEKKTDRKVDPESETVAFDGQVVSYVKKEYYMLNKPWGVVSATEDNLHRTVVDLIVDRKRNDLFPVGRLDIDTEGLLLITNDGDLAHRLLSPKKHVDKRYFAMVEGGLPEDAKEQFEQGLTLSDGTPVMPAELEIIEKIGGKYREPLPVSIGMEHAEKNDDPVNVSSPVEYAIVTIREGKFHQVKRMFEAIGCKVVYLKRLSMGSLELDTTLKVGEYRSLTDVELMNLMKES